MKDATPLLTLWLPGEDWNAADYAREFEVYKFRQQAIVDCADGLLAPGTLLDMIEATGIDPVAYTAEVAETAHFLIHHG